jgi:hypothetical protein
MTYLILALVCLIVGALVDHFFYRMLKADADTAKEVLITSLRKGKQDAEALLAEAQAKLDAKR